MSSQIRVLEWIYTLQLPECQGTGCSKQTRYRKFKWFTLKCVCDMIETYCQMHNINKYSQHSSIIWQVRLNDWAFVYELGGCVFQYRCNHLNFRHRAYLEQAVPWHSGNSRVYIHSETSMWHYKNTQRNALADLVKWLCVCIGTKWLCFECGYNHIACYPIWIYFHHRDNSSWKWPLQRTILHFAYTYLTPN